MGKDFHAITPLDLRVQREKEDLAKQVLRSRFPELVVLVQGLSCVLSRYVGRTEAATVVERQANPYRSNFPSEIVTCRLADGSERRLLCKYGIPHDHTGHGYWGGTSYEAAVYRNILGPLGATAPIYYGEYKEPVSGETWLVIEYVEGLRLNKAAPESMAEAARWIGRLHAASEALVPEPALYVKTYTSDYYLGWARRTALYTRHLGPELSWVRTVCERASDSFSHLLSSPPVVVHGEYYPENILVRTGAILPVDWQSAAIGAGEIDLASLTEGRWDAEVVRECVEAYRDVRWPDGAPPNFEKTLTAARLYWPLRWLGDKPEWTVEESRRPYFGELRSQAERLGII